MDSDGAVALIKNGVEIELDMSQGFYRCQKQPNPNSNQHISKSKEAIVIL